jgi:hypothetical protein
VQRRRAVVVFAENKIRIVFEQRLDLSQVALPSRVMNLAAKGGAAPSQRNQRDEHDGGEAGNWRVAESAEESVYFIHGSSLLSVLSSRVACIVLMLLYDIP